MGEQDQRHPLRRLGSPACGLCCAAGYYHDAQSGFYYDANSGLYYDSASQCWLAQDPATGEYQPYSAPGSAAPSVDGISTAAQAAAGAAPPCDGRVSDVS